MNELFADTGRRKQLRRWASGMKELTGRRIALIWLQGSGSRSYSPGRTWSAQAPLARRRLSSSLYLQ
jgi:hypothetical protein